MSSYFFAARADNVITTPRHHPHLCRDECGEPLLLATSSFIEFRFEGK